MFKGDTKPRFSSSSKSLLTHYKSDQSLVSHTFIPRGMLHFLISKELEVVAQIFNDALQANSAGRDCRALAQGGLSVNKMDLIKVYEKTLRDSGTPFVCLSGVGISPVQDSMIYKLLLKVFKNCS